MKTERKQQLAEKGWNDNEIRQAEGLLERDAQHDIFLSKLVFWSALVVIIFANLLVSLVLIPFLIVFDRLMLYSIVVVLAGVIGFLYNFLITDIGHLETKHHVLAAIIVPLVALANIGVMVAASNKFIADLQVGTQPHDPIMVSVVFAAVLILPFVLDKVRMLWKGRKVGGR